MAGSTIGTQLKITTWGESHGKAIGVVIDGCPAGLPLTEADLQPYLDRRRPGQSRFSTQRKESDQVEILSGTFEGRTTGTPISLIVFNQDQRSHDYREIAGYYRPGHADYTFDAKYGFRDYRGGGRSSGRETIGRVAAGAVAAKLLEALDIFILAYSRSIGPVEISASAETLLASACAPDLHDAASATNTYHSASALDTPHASGPKPCTAKAIAALRQQIAQNPLYMPEEDAAARAQEFLEGCMRREDSTGGIIECIITGMPAGVGDPVFEKLDAQLAKAMFSIGAVKGFEIGDGFAAARSLGSENNDSFFYDETGAIQKRTNHAGGILGGISDGSPILFRTAVKPTPSIASPQQTAGKNGENMEISIRGRHDPIIVPRAVVVVEAMTALTVADLLLTNLGAKMETLTQFYRRKDERAPLD